MPDLVLPQIECISVRGHTGSYKIGPASSDLALSLGISLRRVLLSSLPGAAITTMQIEGVKHEFQDIQDIKEDVTDIIQNLKRVRLRSFTDAPVSIFLDVSGTGVVTAGHIECPGTVEIVSPGLHIATLDNENAHLKMEMVVESGRGFVSAESVQARILDSGDRSPIGVILIDAIYSPVTFIKYSIEHTRLGDFVFMEITTDGTISPAEAMQSAASLLIRQFSVFAGPFEHPKSAPLRAFASELGIPDYVCRMSLADLDLQFRTLNALRRVGLTQVWQILEMDNVSLLLLRNIGEKTLQELADSLKTHRCFPDFTKGQDLWEES